MLVEKENGDKTRFLIPYKITVVVKDYGKNEVKEIDLNEIAEFNGDLWTE